LNEANLSRATLNNTDLARADLSETICIDTLFEEAILNSAILLNTNFERATLKNCSVWGISSWDLNLKDTIQSGLTITLKNQPTVTVDSIEIAQFMYLLLNNSKIRNIIDTLTCKVVLILGRFTPERKIILNSIAEQIKSRDLIPVMFDFDKPATRDFTEVIKILSSLAKFIIVDLTDGTSVPYELANIVPYLAIPVQPLLADEVDAMCAPKREFSMFTDLKKYPWVLGIKKYSTLINIGDFLDTEVFPYIDAKLNELSIGK